MPSTVLGKRTRSSVAITDRGNIINVQPKKNVPFVIASDDENENPFVGPKRRRTARHGETKELDELVVESKPSLKRRVVGTVPAKHGAAESRVALSPRKINEHFTTSKSVSSTNGKPSTPQTPRHRDALAKKVPITPKHRVGIVGKPLTPRTPGTPATPRGTIPTAYNDARQIFTRSTNPGRLVGRDTERSELEDFISSRLEEKKSGCIYVSGPPGTGKSALINEVCGRLVDFGSVKSSYINCMSVKTAGDIYGKLLEDFGESEERTEKEEMDAVEELFNARTETYLVTLDEIDHLLDIDMDLLYALFEWSLKPDTSLILVGIANALDFTDRFLPRLKSRGLKPHLLPVMPYSAAQISTVITAKLKSLMPSITTGPADYVPFLHPAAIMFLSKKVASQSGDLRKAFDICRRALDLIENETRDQLAKKAAQPTPSPSPSPSKTPLVENINLSSPPLSRSPKKLAKQASSPTNLLAHLTAETAPRATIAHMARITSAIFSNGTSQRLTSLNLQQKAVLCALSAIESRNKQAATITATPSKKDHAAPTIKQLFEAYTALCRRENILHPLTSTEFRDIVGSLETLSLVAGVEGKAGSLATSTTPSRKGRGGGLAQPKADEKRVASSVGKKELEAALNGVGANILRGILEGDGL